MMHRLGYLHLRGKICLQTVVVWLNFSVPTLLINVAEEMEKVDFFEKH